MNTFKKKSLYAALAGVSALGATGAAQAVSVNPDGLGQALIYPYYTVRDKVRRHRRRRAVHLAAVGRQLDAVGEGGEGPLPGGQELPRSSRLQPLPVAQGRMGCRDHPDGRPAPASTRRTCRARRLRCRTARPTRRCSSTSRTPARRPTVPIRRSIVPVRATSKSSRWATSFRARTPKSTVTHIAGVPPCDDFSTASADTVPGSGGLFGNMTLINVLAGEDYGTEATALEGFSSTALWFTPGSVDPQLALVNPKTSVVTTGTFTYVTDWSVTPDAVNPVSAVLMHNHVYNEFIVETGTKSGTDWVVTMPTKRFYIQTSTSISNNTRPPVPAQLRRQQRLVRRRHRHAVRPRRAHDLDAGSFSPPPPTETDAICWEANVITFNSTNVFASKNIANIPTTFAERLARPRRSRWSRRARACGISWWAARSTVFNTSTGREHPDRHGQRRSTACR